MRALEAESPAFAAFQTGVKAGWERTTSREWPNEEVRRRMDMSGALTACQKGDTESDTDAADVIIGTIDRITNSLITKWPSRRYLHG